MRRPLTATAAGLLLALAAGCDGGPAGPEPSALRIRDIILTDAAGAVVAYSHDDHWHGAVRLRVGEALALRASFTELEGGHELPEARFTLDAHPGHALRVTVADPAVASWADDGGVLTVRGLRVGSTRTDFVVVRGATVVYDAPRVMVAVAE